MPVEGPKIHRSFPRLVGHLVYFGVILYFAKDYRDHGPFWPGVTLMGLGTLIRVWAMGHIRKRRSLATGGPYGLTRNPLYLGSFISGIGAGVAIQAWWVIGISAVPLVLLYIPMLRIEDENLKNHYGDEFEEYKKKVTAFFPWPTKYFWKPKERFTFATAVRNRFWGSILYFLVAFLVLDFVLLVAWPAVLGPKPFGTLVSE